MNLQTALTVTHLFVWNLPLSHRLYIEMKIVHIHFYSDKITIIVSKNDCSVKQIV